jgi:hypothetical protein
MSTPFPWLQVGAEVGLSQARAWTGSFALGASWLPSMHTGFMAQARVNRLLTGTVPSLTLPDLYGFVGMSVMSITGVSALAFSEKTPTLQNAASQLVGADANAIFPGFHLGLELRVKNRIGVAAFLETSPTINKSQSIGNYLDLGFIQFHSIGAEVSFCF